MKNNFCARIATCTEVVAIEAVGKGRSIIVVTQKSPNIMPAKFIFFFRYRYCTFPSMFESDQFKDVVTLSCCGLVSRATPLFWVWRARLVVGEL